MSGASSAPATVWQLLASRAAATPEAVAYQQEVGVGRWQPMSWQTFEAHVIQLRRGLYAAGLRKGDRMALIAPVSIEWELLHHAALSLGVVVVGLDAHDLPQRIASMARQAGVVAYATCEPKALATLEAADWSQVRLLLTLGDSTEEKAWPAGPRRMSRAELEDMASSVDVVPQWPAGGDEATIIYTSGTTGAPKGIVYRHEQICLAVAAIADAFHFVGHDSRLLCWLPLSNLFQRMVNLAGVRQGVGTYLLGDPRRVMEVVAAVSPDIFVGVPRFYEKLYQGMRDSIAARPALQRHLIEWAWGIGRRVSQCRLLGRPIPAGLALMHRLAELGVLSRIRRVMGRRLRCMVTGSAATPRYLLEEFHALGWLLLEAYGMSENVLPMAMNRMDGFRFGSVGRPLPGNEVEIGPDGVLKVRGPGLFSGYLHDEHALVLDEQGFYATWDLGEWDRDGFLYLTGRAGDLIKTSVGRRIAPAAVESGLRRVPGVEDALLIGNGRKYVVALCSCPGWVPGEASIAAFKQAVREHLADINAQDRPRGVALLPQKFSIESGELTPNLKLRRSFVCSQYALLIDQLYQVIDSASGTDAADMVILLPE